MFLALLIAATHEESAMKMKRTTLWFLVMGPLILTMFSACILPNCTAFLHAGNSEMVTIAADQLTLQWDAPSTAVDHYTVYFRVHGTPDWVTLADVPEVPLPEYTVAHTVVGDGEFDFAVVAVDASDVRSAYHTSLDTTADPQTGWYVSWYVP
jgi:hypothetical protein